MPSSVVAVTGGTGFLGRHLIKALVASGYQVKALTRRPVSSLGVTWVTGSLDQPYALKQLIADASFVIHLAGQVRGSNYKAFAATNVAGCENLIRATEQAAPQASFLLMSSLVARHPELSHYACSKRVGEDLLKTSALAWTVFRPTAIYGPDDTELLPLFNMIANTGIAPVINRNQGRVSLLHVFDCVSLVLAWVQQPMKAFGQTYELDDGHPNAYSWREIGDIIATKTKRKMVFLTVPKMLLMSVALINNVLAFALRYHPMLTAGKIREVWHPDWRCDSAIATKTFAWQPRYHLDNGLQSILGGR